MEMWPNYLTKYFLTTNVFQMDWRSRVHQSLREWFWALLTVLTQLSPIQPSPVPSLSHLYTLQKTPPCSPGSSQTQTAPPGSQRGDHKGGYLPAWEQYSGESGSSQSPLVVVWIKAFIKWLILLTKETYCHNTDRGAFKHDQGILQNTVQSLTIT